MKDKNEMTIFDLEVKEKKSQAYLNRSRTGSKGGSSSRKGVRTTYDFLSPKEKKKLNGEIEVFNMYETIIPLKEFELKELEIQKSMLSRWRDLYSNAKIIEEMGFDSTWKFYELIKTLGIERKKTYTNEKPRKRKASAKKEEQTPVQEVAESLQPLPGRAATNGSHLEYNGVFTSEQLERIFTKMQFHVEGESSKYLLTCFLTEQKEEE